MSRRKWDLSRLTSRAVHLILLVAWVALVVWKILTFISEPTASETHFEDSFVWPYITVCPYHGLDADARDYLAQNLSREDFQHMENFTLLEGFKGSGSSLLDMMPYLENSTEFNEDPFRENYTVRDGKWTQKVDYAYGGLCGTFEASADFLYLKLARQLEFQEFSDYGGDGAWDGTKVSYVIRIHRLDDFWGGVDDHFTRFSDAEMIDYWLSHDTSLQELVIHPERQIMPNLRDLPCQEDPHYSRSTCWRDCFLDSLNCSLLEGDDTNSKPTCTGADFIWFEDAYNNYVSTYDDAAEESSQLASCSCPRPCELERYNVFVRPSFEKSDEDWIRLKISFSPVKRTIETYVTYDVIDLLADIGGFMGLLLGYSLLSVLDDLKTFVTRLLRRRAASAVGSPGEPQQRQNGSVRPISGKLRVKAQLRRRSGRSRPAAGVYFVRPDMNAWGKLDVLARPQRKPGINY